MKNLMISLVLFASPSLFTTERKKHNPKIQEVVREKVLYELPFELVDIQFKSHDFYYPTFFPRTQRESEKKINPKAVF